LNPRFNARCRPSETSECIVVGGATVPFAGV
jgi:hypothetical protein